MGIQLAVFDMAGTTVSDNNDVSRAFCLAFKSQGITISADMANPVMGYHKPVAIEMMLVKHGLEYDEATIERIHAEFERAMVDFYDYSPYVQPLPGAEELFMRLQENNIKVGLNTGFSRNIASVIIKRFEWLDRQLINDFVGSDEVDMGRPYPFMIHKLMKRQGVTDPQNVAKIGDTKVDIEEGKNAGCKYVVGVTTGSYTRGELELSKPTHIINHLDELSHLLLSHSFHAY